MDQVAVNDPLPSGRSLRAVTLMNVVEYLEGRGHRFRRASSYQMKTTCPLHPDTDPSFYVYLEDGHWHCYAEGIGGDIVGLIWRLEFGGKPGVWKEVFQRARELGVNTETPYLPPLPARRVADLLERQVMTIALDHYREILGHTPAVLDYVEGRGVRRPTELPLGFCAGDPLDFIGLAHRLQAEVGSGWRPAAVSTGILWRSGAEAQVNRVIIAEVRAGEAIWLQSRALDPEAKLRYLNPRELRKPLFGLETLAWDYPVVAIVEGVFDALPLHSIGVPAVATLGNRMADLAIFIQNLGRKRVAIMTDGDETGEAFARNLLGELTEARISAFRLSPAPYKDPGKWAEAEGPEYIAATLCTVATREEVAA